MKNEKEQTQLAKGLNTLYVIAKVMDGVIQQIHGNSAMHHEIKRKFSRLVKQVEAVNREANVVLTRTSTDESGKPVVDRSEKKAFNEAASKSIELINVALMAHRTGETIALQNEIERLKTKFNK